MLTIDATMIDFEVYAIDVISAAQKFILPVPQLEGGGERLIYNAGKNKGHDIHNWSGEPIGERGFIFYNYKDNTIQAVQGDGTGVIIFNLVDQEQANKLKSAIHKCNTNIDQLTLDDLKNIMSFAYDELDLGDVYNSDKTFIRNKMKSIERDKITECCGLHIRDDRDICQAVYIEGHGQFYGPAATPQQFTQGAVIVKQDQDYRLVQPDIFVKTYKKYPNAVKIQLADMKVFNPKVNDIENRKPSAVERLNASRAKSKSPQPGTSRMGR
ncbi:hypothetical protein [Candidatus Rickettsia kedanie]|uniref:Uncharacterized protein n=1 Tax=Candidatus Rickettsia kedanie TaxID=3115352 RepID=A0ABP9TY88_9RICK